MSESPKMSGEACPVEPEGGQAHLMDFIDLELLQRCNFLGILIQDKQSFADQPLIDAEAAVEFLGTVIRNDQHGGLLVEQLQ